jgi:CheY-like chemotaxis protein
MGGQMLQLKLPNADIRRLLDVMLGNVERGADMVKQILLFARGVQGERIPLQPKHLIREILKVVTETFPKSVRVKSSILEEPWLILGDTTQIHQVLMSSAIALVASDGAYAMAIYAERRDEIHVVVTDMMMPVMDGPATIRALQLLNPEVRIIAVNGLSGNGRVLEAAQAGVKLFLPKPYTADRLLKAIA